MGSSLLSARGLLFATLGLFIAGTECATITVSNSLLLTQVAGSIALPIFTFSASGTHTAKGYTTQQANVTSVEGMQQDCDNINLNRKLASDFRSDVLGPGVKGFFYKCEKTRPDTNLYWFTISSADPTPINKLCSPNTQSSPTSSTTPGFWTSLSTVLSAVLQSDFVHRAYTVAWTPRYQKIAQGTSQSLDLQRCTTPLDGLPSTRS
ncbi:uncharacterized protein N7459_006969 [Penicillium hispanicum]|uniref:uncharacterized protein n=1 Tax=Penicillium hispanicum TaxID=1080232 RepID=UPI00253F806A|nr:uncharacterized protein N7459_006969 [Penicillium hispanicum]KAJ5578005.1 hypothetical protein N7459_006969 [Penicillium hispanicum]